MYSITHHNPAKAWTKIALMAASAALFTATFRAQAQAQAPALTQNTSGSAAVASGIRATHVVPTQRAPEPEDESVPPSTTPGHEGIKVHGHWKIAVLNPDGTLAERREFENSLAPDGAITLVSLLLGQAAQYTMGVYVNSNSTTTQVCGSSFLYCFIVPDPTSPYFTAYCQGNACAGGLAATSTNLGNAIQLAGQLTAASAGTITQVSSVNFYCPGQGASPNTCGAGLAGRGVETLTTATLPTPLSVAAGQVVQITVNLSFS